VDADQLLLGLVAYIVLLLSLTVHEAAHAWTALRGGDQTAYLGGQVSLDPRPHIRREPFGMVVLPLISLVGGSMFGYASAPIDPRWAYVHPKRAAVVAAAGPLANLALALIGGSALRLGVAVGWFVPVPVSSYELAVVPGGGVGESVVLVLSVLFSMNLLLFVFNLMPVPPLDGSSAIGLLLSESSARRLQEWMARPMLALGGILLAYLLMRRIVGPVLWAAVDLLYLGAG